MSHGLFYPFDRIDNQRESLYLHVHFGNVMHLYSRVHIYKILSDPVSFSSLTHVQFLCSHWLHPPHCTVHQLTMTYHDGIMYMDILLMMILALGDVLIL